MELQFLILQRTPTLCVPVADAALFIYSRVHTGRIPKCNFPKFSELGPFHPSKGNKGANVPSSSVLSSSFLSVIKISYLVTSRCRTLCLNLFCLWTLPLFRRCQPSHTLSLCHSLSFSLSSLLFYSPCLAVSSALAN